MEDRELLALQRLRVKLQARVQAGGLTPLEALQRLHIIVDAMNRRFRFVRHWGETR